MRSWQQEGNLATADARNRRNLRAEHVLVKVLVQCVCQLLGKDIAGLPHNTQHFATSLGS